MARNIVDSAITIMIVIYSVVVFTACAIGGVVEKQEFIDGEEIRDVCDVLRVLVVDDTRAAFAIGTVVLMVPVFVYGALKKFRIKPVNVMLVAFVVLWCWVFIFKFRNCLWF